MATAGATLDEEELAHLNKFFNRVSGTCELRLYFESRLVSQFTHAVSRLKSLVRCVPNAVCSQRSFVMWFTLLRVWVVLNQLCFYCNTLP